MRKVAQPDQVKEPTRGRPRVYGERVQTTLRFIAADHDFLQLVSFLKDVPITRVLEEAIDEYRTRHQSELEDLQAAKLKQKIRPAPGSGARGR